MNDDDLPAPTSGVRAATGRDRDEWFALLDAWGAAGRAYRDIADWLTGEHGVSDWWAQKLIVEYEEDRGLRAPGVRRDGTFTVTASKTISAPVDRLYEAFVDPTVRQGWLPDVELRVRTSRPGRSARFDWNSDGTRVAVTFAATGRDKTQVSIEHQRLPHADAAARAKAEWRRRLAALKAELEA